MLSVRLVQRCASDGTRKYLLSLWDKEQIEAVFEQLSLRYSLCISSQVGLPDGLRLLRLHSLGEKKGLIWRGDGAAGLAVEKEAGYESLILWLWAAENRSTIMKR